MEPAKQFGEIIRRLRQQAELTQEELAFRAGMNVTYLSDIERGRSMPSLAIIIDLARGLEAHPSELLRDLQIDGAPLPRKRPTT